MFDSRSKFRGVTWDRGENWAGGESGLGPAKLLLKVAGWCVRASRGQFLFKRQGRKTWGGSGNVALFTTAASPMKARYSSSRLSYFMQKYGLQQ